MKRFGWILCLLLLFRAAPAAAAPGMCGITGTVYNVDGSVAGNGTVVFRVISTQTFGSDTVQVSPEYVNLSALGVIPGGVQVPLGSRIFIQVGRDKPVSVVAPTSGGSCPITFGALYGSALSTPPPPTTIVTSINTVDTLTGTNLVPSNPAGAGPATLTLSGTGVQPWTPTITGGTTNPTVTYTTQIGRYYQYGATFHWMFMVAWSAFSGGSGTLQVSGFPLTQQNTANFFAGADSWNWGGLTLTANYTAIGCQLAPNASTFTITEHGSGQAAASATVAMAGATGQILCEGWGSQ